MKLVILYGPMGVGRLTVAKELQKITHYPLFHNHITFDFLAPLGGIGTEEFWSRNNALRCAWVEAAAKAKFPGMIMTFCYAKGYDDATMKRFKRIVERHGGQACFVQLLAPEAVLHRRIKEPSRKKHMKVKDSKTLNKLLKQYDLYSPIPFVTSLTLDTVAMTPRKTAVHIKKQYRL